MTGPISIRPVTSQWHRGTSIVAPQRQWLAIRTNMKAMDSRKADFPRSFTADEQYGVYGVSSAIAKTSVCDGDGDGDDDDNDDCGLMSLSQDRC